MHSTVAVIPARWDSQRLPGKVLADIGGQPMLWWTWQVCRRAELPVVIATDSDRVAEAATLFGAEVVRTDPCDSGTDRVAAVAATHDARWVLGVQADEPMLDPTVLQALASTLVQTGADLATPMCAVEPGHVEDPNIVLCAADAAGRALWFSRHRTSAYRHLGVYGWRREALLRFAASPAHPEELAQRLEQLRALHAGMDIRLVDVPKQPPGVDTASELHAVRTLLAQGQQSCTTRASG